uniref:Geranylgeranyl pyrophosphate synthase n=1 Tax=Mesocestoides corti TaxID=53468 RepID=A0A5K3EX60_MESCO
MDLFCKETGGLIGMAVKLMQLFSTNNGNFKSLSDALGLWFQIRDDYANLVDTSYHEAKNFADDLTEGKFSFPVVHAINTFPHDHQVMAILQQRTLDHAVKEHCVQHLNELGSLMYTARTLIDLEKQCRRFVEKLGGNPYLLQLFDEYSKVYREADSWEPRPYNQLASQSGLTNSVHPSSSFRDN